MNLDEIRKMMAKINLEANQIRNLYTDARVIMFKIHEIENSETPDDKELEFLYLKLEEIFAKGKKLDLEQVEIVMQGKPIKRYSTTEFL